MLPPAGVTPAVEWEPAEVAPPAEPIGLLADSLDATGELTSLTTFVHPVDAAIAEQFRLKLDSGVAVIDQGQGLHRIEYKTDSTPLEVEHEVQRVLKPFIERRHAELVRLEHATDEGPDSQTTAVTYRNLMTSKEQTVSTTPSVGS